VLVGPEALCRLDAAGADWVEVEVWTVDWLGLAGELAELDWLGAAVALAAAVVAAFGRRRWWARWVAPALLVAGAVVPAEAVATVFPGNAWAATTERMPVSPTAPPTRTRLERTRRRMAASRDSAVCLVIGTPLGCRRARRGTGPGRAVGGAGWPSWEKGWRVRRNSS
jgi:hypothetical protein